MNSDYYPAMVESYNEGVFGIHPGDVVLIGLPDSLEPDMHARLEQALSSFGAEFFIVDNPRMAIRVLRQGTRS